MSQVYVLYGKARCNCDDSYECAGEEYAMPQRYIFSCRQKDECVSECVRSDVGRVFHVDYPTMAKLRGL